MPGRPTDTNRGRDACGEEWCSNRNYFERRTRGRPAGRQRARSNETTNRRPARSCAGDVISRAEATGNYLFQWSSVEVLSNIICNDPADRVRAGAPGAAPRRSARACFFPPPG